MSPRGPIGAYNRIMTSHESVSRRRLDVVDERILEYLEEEGWSTPRVLASVSWIHASRARVRERLRVLGRVGLVARDRGRDWDITSRGQEYLAGELDAHHLRWPEASRGAARVFDGG